MMSNLGKVILRQLWAAGCATFCLSLGFTVSAGVLGAAHAQTGPAFVQATGSQGCQAVNGGGLDLFYDGNGPTGTLTKTLQMTFDKGDVLTFIYDDIISASATDDTAAVTIFEDTSFGDFPVQQNTETYTIPETGNRSLTTNFEAVDDFPESGLSVTCEPAVRGTIAIKVLSDVAENFSFSGDLGAFTANSPANNAGVTTIFTDLLPDSYSITEMAPASFDLTALACTGAASQSTDLVSATATVNLMAGEDVTCTFTNKQKPGSISIITQTDGEDGTFDYTGTQSSFSITTLNAMGQQDFSDLSAGSYSFTQSTNSDFKLTDIFCSDSSALSDVPSGSVTVTLDPGESLTCTFVNEDLFDEKKFRDDTVNAIRGFSYRRARAMLNAEPDRTNFHRRNPDVLWEDEHTDPLKMSAKADDLGQTMRFLAQTDRAESALFHQGLELWVEGNYTKAKDDFSVADIESTFGVLFLGADIQATENMIFGALASFDWAEESLEFFDESTEQLLSQDVNGTGWMVGPYLSARLAKNLFFSARVAAGQSDNELSLDTRVSDDPFETDRFLARAALTGNHMKGDFRFTPTASVTWFEETSKAYMSKTGVAIPETTLQLGRAELEPELAWRRDLADGNWLETQLAFAAIWDFETPDDLMVQNIAVPTDEFRGRLEGGLQMNWQNGNSLRLSGSYDGIGATGYDAYSAGIWFDMPLGRKTSRKPAPPVIPAPEYKDCPDGARVLAVDPCPQEPAPVPAPPEDLGFTVLFDHDKSNLLPEEIAKIDAALLEAEEREIKIVLLGGHSDLSGSNAYNEGLSLRRAVVVRDALMARGVPVEKITYEFFGERRPAVPTADGVRLRANRRTEVIIKFQ